MDWSIGVDVGGTNIALGLVNQAYDIVARHDEKTRAPRSAESITVTIALAIRALLATSGLSTADLSSIGVGLPGIVDSNSGELLFATNLALSCVNFPTLLQRHFPNTAIMVSNDADCAVLGEYLAGEAKSYDSALLLTLGTGVGGAFIQHHKIFRGGDGLGIEPGHIVVETEYGVVCGCGQRGCLETYASINGLVRLAKEMLSEGGDSILRQSFPALNTMTIFNAVRGGDRVAIAIHERFIRYLASGIKTLIAVYRPHIILIGGGLSNAPDLLIEPLQSALKEGLFAGDILVAPPIRVASLKNDAGIIGASQLVRNASF